MAKKTRKEVQDKIVEYCQQGKSDLYITKTLNISPETIRRTLKEYNVERKLYDGDLTDKEKDEICKLYLEDKIDEIIDKYHFITKSLINKIINSKNIKAKNNKWATDEINYLKEYYGKRNINDLYLHMNKKHSKKAITTKAILLGLTKSQEWTDNELQILKDNYSYVTKEEMSQLLPTRTEAAIALKAQDLGIKSYKYLNEKYSKEEKQFIIDNFGILTDEEMAQHLGKTPYGIRDQRYTLGLLYLKKDYSNYINLMDFFRAHIYDWKKDSIEKCNYCCILTGSKDFDVHHLYGFNLICDETFSKLEWLSKLKSDNIKDYTKKELDEILEIFQSIHNKYPLGVCIRKDLHKLFHKIYGAGGNTPEQWNNFIKKYKNNEYKI